jgi:lipopolysaccharide transport system permease protein
MMNRTHSSDAWDIEIKPTRSLFDLRFRELWHYRDLVMLFVRRDFIAQYKQSILGPLWHVFQPLIQTLLYTIVFAGVLNISTGSNPRALFYLSGIIIWNFFATCLGATSNTFLANASIFGKVYFPRMTVPVSVILSNLVRFGIQFVIFLVFLLYYIFATDAQVMPNAYLLAVPLLILIMALMGLGFGMIVTSFTTKYRDLSYFLPYGIQLLLYLTPIIYPSYLWGKYQWILQLNPLSSVVEMFRYAFMGGAEVPSFVGIIYSFLFALIAFVIGTLLFNRVEKSFMDTV